MKSAYLPLSSKCPTSTQVFSTLRELFVKRCYKYCRQWVKIAKLRYSIDKLVLFSHPSIVGYKEAFFEDQSACLCLVMDFLDDGDLYQKIVKYQKQSMMIEEHKIWAIFIEMVKALKVLHSRNILHRDLKSANVFLQKNGNAMLGDLNVSKVAKKGLLYTQTGTPYYASPEVWRDQPYGSKSDIWSLGCVLYEMVTLKPPFRANDMNGLYKRVLKGQYPPIS